MRKLRPKTIHSTIFLYSAAIISVVIAASMFLYYFTMSNGFVRNYISMSQQLTKIVSSGLDDTVRSVDILQKRMLESDTVLKYVFEDLPNRENSDTDSIYLHERQFEQTIYGLAGFELGFRHLSILTLDGTLASFGLEYSFDAVPVTAELHKNYFAPLIQKNGLMSLVAPEQEKLSASLPTVSLCRAFSRYPLNPPKAIIEIQLDYNALSRAVNDMVLSYETLSDNVVVYNERGQLIYPIGLESSLLESYRALATDKKQREPFTGREEIITKYTSAYTGWTTCVITPYEAIAANTRQYLFLAISVGFAAICLMLLLSYRVAKSVSVPIIGVRNSLSALRLDNLGQADGSLVKSDYNELELLGEAFRIMQTRLDSSLATHVHLRTLSIQSRLLALRAQMNPHFLYNTLSIIAILAEDNGDARVSQMCHRLVEMLRYSSSEQDCVSFAEELRYTENYARLISVRFEDKIQFVFDCEPALSSVEIPCMIVQPLCENCVKHARQGGAALTIMVHGTVCGDGWQIKVCDDGKGFSAEAIEAFRSSVNMHRGAEELNESAVRSASGIGLANIYTRMRLYYGGSFKFQIENSTDGAVVTIGGALTNKKEMTEHG